MLNKVQLLGNISTDIDARTMQSGDKVCNFNLATNETWKDKTTGEKKEKAEFHRIVVFSQGLCKVIESYLSKGSKIYLEGAIRSRSWEQDGVKKYTTEIVLDGFNSKLIMLDSKGETAPKEPIQDDMGDQIPF